MAKRKLSSNQLRHFLVEVMTPLGDRLVYEVPGTSKKGIVNALAQNGVSVMNIRPAPGGKITTAVGIGGVPAAQKNLNAVADVITDLQGAQASAPTVMGARTMLGGPTQFAPPGALPGQATGQGGFRPLQAPHTPGRVFGGEQPATSILQKSYPYAIRTDIEPPAIDPLHGPSRRRRGYMGPISVAQAAPQGAAAPAAPVTPAAAAAAVTAAAPQPQGKAAKKAAKAAAKAVKAQAAATQAAAAAGIVGPPQPAMEWAIPGVGGAATRTPPPGYAGTPSQGSRRRRGGPQTPASVQSSPTKASQRTKAQQQAFSAKAQQRLKDARGKNLLGKKIPHSVGSATAPIRSALRPTPLKTLGALGLAAGTAAVGYDYLVRQPRQESLGEAEGIRGFGEAFGLGNLEAEQAAINRQAGPVDDVASAVAGISEALAKDQYLHGSQAIRGRIGEIMGIAYSEPPSAAEIFLTMGGM